jgi:hypothetical protein
MGREGRDPMITELHWRGPEDDTAAEEFFRQTPKGVRSAEPEETPGIKPKWSGDKGIPGERMFLVITKDGVPRWCRVGRHWLWDGVALTHEACGEGCPR